MTIQISSLNMRYENNTITGVQIYFSAFDESKQTNINGYVPLTMEEYRGNEALDLLTDKVRTKLIERLDITAE